MKRLVDLVMWLDPDGYTRWRLQFPDGVAVTGLAGNYVGARAQADAQIDKRYGQCNRSVVAMSVAVELTA